MKQTNLVDPDDPERVLFSHDELACKHTSVVKLAPGFADELLILRLAFAMPMVVNSCCRSGIHNRAIGGHPQSLHLYDVPRHDIEGTCAIDIRCLDGGYMLELLQLAIKLGWSVGVARCGGCISTGGTWRACRRRRSGIEDERRKHESIPKTTSPYHDSCYYRGHECGRLLRGTAGHDRGGAQVPQRILRAMRKLFSSDGCSFAPDFNLHGDEFLTCCEWHDFRYANGGTAEDRLYADKKLRECIRKKGHPVLAWIYYGAVRVFGSLHWPDKLTSKPLKWKAREHRPYSPFGTPF